MLTLLGTLLTSILSGGATGLLGVLFQRYFDMKSKAQDLEMIKLNHSHAVELSRLEIERGIKMAEAKLAEVAEDVRGRIAVAVEEREGREAVAASETQAASYAADRATFLTDTVLKTKHKWLTYAMGGVDLIRGLTRPALTAYLVVIAHLMYMDLYILLAERGQALTGTEMQALVLQVITTMLYLATTAVVWWFGSRPPKRSSDK